MPGRLVARVRVLVVVEDELAPVRRLQRMEVGAPVVSIALVRGQIRAEPLLPVPTHVN